MALEGLCGRLTHFVHSQLAAVCEGNAPAFVEEIVDFNINNIGWVFHFVQLI